MPYLCLSLCIFKHTLYSLNPLQIQVDFISEREQYMCGKENESLN